ncbi:NLR family CARD domain-containing protein 3-like, partial [Acropora muricata]|uniref:NLR family CARD domain-containing protein 3-like n=1 Tax=Acropora muricata TaxID=159855 RepID=UPI0034E47213
AVALSEALECNKTLTHLCFLGDAEPEDPIGESGASALARALKKNSTLKCLVLADNSIQDSGALALADALQTNSTLTQLGLLANGIGNLGIEAICKALQFNHVITHLDLRNNTIGDSGAEALAGALQLPATQLSHLDLEGCEIISLGVESFAGALQTNRSLTHLSLAGLGISYSGNAPAEAIQFTRTLIPLDPSCSGIGDLETEAICKVTTHLQILAGALQTNRSLTHLNLRNNEISDTEAIQLAQTLLDKNSTLTCLDLSDNNIGAEEEASSSISCSVTALAEALQLNRTLTHLELSNNQISDTEAIQLAQTLLDKNNTLTYLDLSRNNIGVKGKAKLELVDRKRCFILF